MGIAPATELRFTMRPWHCRRITGSTCRFMRHHTEEVHVQLVLRVLRLREFDRAGNAEARVVDEHVNVVFLL